MEEYGQPMHAFDLSAIHGGKIIVKRAEDGARFVTLDGQERTLDKDILMINDPLITCSVALVEATRNASECLILPPPSLLSVSL